MKPYSYHLEDPADRKMRWQSCIQTMMGKRIKTLEVTTWQIYSEEKDYIQDSFHSAVLNGIEATSKLVGTQQKGPLRYIHVSYLLNSAFTGEMLVRLDFYDNEYFMDHQNVECYWDYQCLFPGYAAAVQELETQLSEEVVRLSSYELQRARLYYQTCNFILLKDIIRELVKTKQFKQIVEICSEPKVSILFGAYLDQAVLIYELGGE